MKKIIYIIIGLLVLLGLFFALNTYIYKEKQGEPAIKKVAIDPRNASYAIDGVSIELTNGVSALPQENSSSMIETKYFGNELTTDLDGDGRDDVVFFLTQEKGGSGTFFYVTGALNTESGYIGLPAVFLGDRIAPQTINKGNGSIVVVNYVDRKIDESFAVAPSVGKSIWLKLDTGTMQFGEVAQNFEGEADPKLMKLDMKAWNWISVSDSVNGQVLPKKPNVFTLTLKNDSTFSASTDCNGIGGEYKVTGNKIVFSKMISTLMFCEGSQESIFQNILNDAMSFEFTSKGELIFTLKNGGSAIFR
ncbi:MAG: META domain-containing protein [Minisyncoccota bacterium]